MDWFDFIAKLVVGGICAIAFIASILRNKKKDISELETV
jgi:hypothetical protein